MTSGERAPKRWEPGKILARALCALFAAIGLLPLALTLLVSSEPMKRWAERETARVLREELGVSATYRVEVKLLPLRLAVLDLTVPASDGGTPAFVADSVTVSPRVFALLGGRLDLGAIELNRPRTRLVVTDGKLVNVRYHLREQSASAPKGDRAPFSSLSISERRFGVTLDGTEIATGPIDLDVFAERGPSFEIALQADESRVTRKRIDETVLAKTNGKEVVDDDVVCRVENLETHLGLTLKTRIARDAPCPSLTGLYRGALWMERECHELFGIRFEGHPDLRRLLLPEDWEGYPLRKDYAVDTPHPPYR